MKKAIITSILLSSLVFGTDVSFETEYKSAVVDPETGGQSINEYSGDYELNHRKDELMQLAYLQFSSTEQVLVNYSFYTGKKLKLVDLPFMNLDHMTEEYVESYLRFWNIEESVYITHDVILSNLLATAIIHNPDEYKQILDRHKDSLSVTQKIHFAKEFGRELGDLYNFERLNENRSTGTVSFDRMMRAIKNQDSDLAGVCGDVAAIQVALLDELGVDDVYIVSYKSQANGYSTHAKVVAIDPDNDHVAIGLNYGQTEVRDARYGVNAITDQSLMPDDGLEVRVYDKTGDLVDVQLNDMGKIVFRSSGGEIPFFRDSTTYSYKNGHIKTKYFGVNYTHATTGSGDKVKAIGLYGKVEKEYKGLRGKVSAGVSQAQSQRETLKGRIHQNVLYYRVSGEVSYVPNFFNIKIGAKGTVDGRTILTDYNYRTYSDKTYHRHTELKYENTWGEFYLEKEIEVGDGLKFTPRIILESYYYKKGLYQGEKSSMQLMKVRPEIEATYYGDGFVASSTVGLLKSDYGTSLYGDHSLRVDEYSVHLKHVNPLEKAPVFLEGQMEKYEFSFKKHRKKNLSYGLGVEYDVEFDRLAVKASLEYKY